MTGLTARRVSVEWRPERAHVHKRVEGRLQGAALQLVVTLDTSRYFVYILTCSDGTLYVGSASDVVERELVHNEGRGARYTACRLPVHVVYTEGFESLSAAKTREAQLKRWSHAKKKALVEGELERLHHLAKRRR